MPTRERMQTRTQVPWCLDVLPLLILFGALVLLFLTVKPPYAVEFSMDSLNHLTEPAFAVALWLAVAFALRTDLRNRDVTGHDGYALLQVVLAASLVGIAFFVQVLDWSGNKPVQIVDRGVYRLVLREEDCGATCSANIALRQEWRLAPGLLRVRPLGFWTDAGTGSIMLRRAGADADSFDVHIAAWRDNGPFTIDAVIVADHTK